MSQSVEAFDPDAVEPEVLEGLVLVGNAEKIRIASQQDLEFAAGFRAGVKALIAEIETTFGPLKKRAFDSHKAIVAEENRRLAEPRRALALVNDAMGKYEAQQRAAAAVAAARAAQEAQEQGAAPGADPGAPLVVPAEHVEVPRVAGLGFFSKWEVRVDNKLALIKAIAAGWGSPEILDVDIGWLADLASKGTKEIPGCTITETRRPRG